jgi:glutamyl-tRNA reductase
VYLTLIGLNHRTAPIEIRERLSFPESSLASALASLSSNPFLSETAILSTCNRTEIIARSSSPDIAEQEIFQFLAARSPEDTDIHSHLYVYHGQAAVTHLFRVAAGLDSLVLGEAQILRQIRDAFAAASDNGAIGVVLNALFRAAIVTGKRARSETDIGAGGFSIGHAAVDLARSIFGSLEGAVILILGAGKMSELTARHLKANGSRFIFVANRSHDKAVALSNKLGGQAIRFEEFPEKLAQSDVIISSTSSPHFIVRKEMLIPVVKRRRGRPLFLIDIAVPRDIEPETGSLENVFLYDVDDLEEVVSDMARDRTGEVQKVEAIIYEETEKYLAWWRSLGAVPVVSQIRNKHEEIRQSELTRLRNQLPDLPDRAWECIEAATRSLVTRITKDPISKLKESAVNGEDQDIHSLLEAAREIFALEEPLPAIGSSALDVKTQQVPIGHDISESESIRRE